MLVFRYLAKEVFITFFAITGILVFIISSNQLALYMNRAASGSVPGLLVFKLMCLEIPNLMMVLIPFGFYLSVILAFGRIYSENEMVIFQTGGLSVRKLTLYTFLMASVVAMIVAQLVIINPGIAAERSRLLQTSGMKAFIQMLAPQQFQPLSNNQILFVDKVNRNHTEAQGLFIAKRNQEVSDTWKWQIISANKLHLEKQKNQAEHLVMQGGNLYNLSSSGAKAQLGSFETGVFKIPETIFNPRDDLRGIPLSTIWQQRNSNVLYKAEFQWRVSSILMVFVLSFVAVSISPVNPRSGRFAKIFPAVIIFLIYIAILFEWRERVAHNLWSGGNMFWVHGLIFLIGAFLFWRQKRLNIS